ncbi:MULTISPECIES: SDR family NAD(P)-dependent oxidoreductase [Gluconobacter]|uniref:SDR family NAD(P)-dependent oxidoreductase n=1 Tax=Gluconobacter TaxID=441 RepID=UPI001C03D125|nr:MULTISPECIES: SDR family NAD(P)-dependent oxidoreductase [Gluconobacter]
MIRHVWLITGSSRGFGRSLATAALEAGDSIVATGRRPEQLAELVEKYGACVLPVALDITDAAAAREAIDAASRISGG